MSKNIIYKFLALILLIFEGFNVLAQDNKININNIVENISLHTDRDVYFLDENLYFSAYYSINNLQFRKTLSKVLYLELINLSTANPIIKHKYKITDYKSTGKVHLPNNISTGNYILRAYTQYQRNFSLYNFAYKFITIINPETSSNNVVVLNKNNIPNVVCESNTLIKNVENYISIYYPKKVKNDSSIFIVDSKNEIVKTINKNGSNLFKVTFTPKELTEYKLMILEGDTTYLNLPEVVDKGIQTNVSYKNTYLQYNVFGKGNINNNYEIRIYSVDYREIYKQDITLKNKFKEVIIPNNILDFGINYIALFNKQEEIVKINSIFKPKNIANNVNLKTVKDTFNTRQDVSVSINTPVKYISNKVSVYVVKHGARKEDYEFNPSIYLKNSLLLSDFLNSKNIQDADVISGIMILFDAKIDKEVFRNKIKKSDDIKLKFIPEVEDLSIKGILVNKELNKPVSNRDVYVSVLFNNPQLHVCKTNKNGEFKMVLRDVYGINDIFLCTETYFKDEKEHEILIQNPFSEKMLQIKNIKSFINDKQLLKELYFNSQLNKLDVKSSINTNKKRIKSEKININVNYKVTTYLDDYVELKNMHELFYEVVKNVKVKNKKGKFYLFVINDKGQILQGTPLVLLDNVPVFNHNAIMDINIKDIKKVDVIYRPYYLGNHVFKGVISIASKTENYSGVKFPESSTFVEYKGLNDENNNALTEYSTTYPKNKPWFKNILFKQNNFKLKDNKTYFNFKTSDAKGQYDIIIEGYTSNGEFIYDKKSIIVK